VRYEVRGSVGVHWKSEKSLIIDKHPLEVVASYPYEETYLGKVPEGIVVGENGKLWMQGKMVGSVIVAGESACLELQVKNHSNKKVIPFPYLWRGVFLIVVTEFRIDSNFDANALLAWFEGRPATLDPCSNFRHPYHRSIPRA